MNGCTFEKDSGQRLIFLDILRIVAFLSVLLGHKIFSGEVYSLGFSGFGVVIFFLISGYVITKVLLNESPKEFLIKRFFRIYPLYWFAVLLQHFLSNEAVSFSKLIAQMLLVGDFFATPYALGGVEWTLRIEILFYLQMSLLKRFGLLRRGIASLIFIALTLFLQKYGPFTTHYGWSDGYITLFAPFLFFGSIIFLIEKKLINLLLGWFCVGYIYFSYLILVPKISPNANLIKSNFVICGCFIFLIFWLLQKRLKPSRKILLLSDLTYSVYLFHNWLWEYLQNVLQFVGASGSNIEIFLMLLALCYLSHKTIEQRFNSVGKSLAKGCSESK